MRPLFRHVGDHKRRAQDDIDSLREVLAFAFAAGLMSAKAQQNAITRKLAAWAAILAVSTAVAALYGMNFQNMPALQWRYGYEIVGGVIGTICGAPYFRFRRSGWLQAGFRSGLSSWCSARPSIAVA
jgi:magnesium transporter